MKTHESHGNKLPHRFSNNAYDDLKGYPLYPEEDDIYKKMKKNRRINPDDMSQYVIREKLGKRNQKDFDEDMTGEDLDIPGVDLEDEFGSEDEENNYYSLGGDDHLDLDENTGRL